MLKGKPVFLWNLVDLERLKWEGAEALPQGQGLTSEAQHQAESQKLLNQIVQ
jgi:hypothetical protein